MVNPVTGPFTRTIAGFGPPTLGGYSPEIFRRTMTWRRQKPPFGLELPYKVSTWQITSMGGGDGYDYVEINTAFPLWHPDQSPQRVYNAAYSTLMGKINAHKATLGATLGEWRSSQSMIVTRATQLYNGYRAAKRGDLTGLKRLWGKDAGIRNRSRSAGNHVLEYSFGWAPLVSDIASAVEVLADRLPAFRVRARRYHQDTIYGSSNFGAQTRFYRNDFRVGYDLRAQIQVSNPNLALGQQLGLLNLASVAWELVPNSYILDYFVNVNDFLASFSDRIGLEFTREAKTLFISDGMTITSKWNPPYGAPYPPLRWTSKANVIERTTGLPGPTISLRLPWRMSVQRASTSIARLLQQLKGK